MKKSILVIILICLITAALGQTNVRDILWSKFSTTKYDTTKVLLLARVSDIYGTGISPDSAFLIGQRGLKLVESKGYTQTVYYI